MGNKNASIPEHTWSAIFSEGIVISKTTFEDTADFKDVERSHRDDWHIFLLQEKGTTLMEIDFQKQTIEANSVIYIHPNQVHRLIAFEQATVFNWAINNENLKPEYLRLLEELTPVKALSLDKETFSVISETAAVGIKYTERKQEVLYHSLLKDSCNTLVALVASQYLAESKSNAQFSRFHVITKSFKLLLEQEFKIVKKPMLYAGMLSISTPYLNECVKNITGHSVTHHIQRRIILEAERLLYHSDKSVKEIAGELGYDDYNYFTRLFTKVTGITPVAFRNENHE